MQVGRGDRLCVLALPSDMGVAEFCSYVGAYLPQIKDMRLVRREGGRAACMVLLRFISVATTDEFYLNFNNKPVRGLEQAQCHKCKLRLDEVSSANRACKWCAVLLPGAGADV